jgi:hypothetical protein
MGFIGVNPPAARLAFDGATEQARVALAVDSAQRNMPGHIAFFKDSVGRISVLKYMQAFASIPKGAAVMNVNPAEATTGGVSSSAFSQDPQVVTIASIGFHNFNICKGIAAAEVSNTGYWSWFYISGYCPDAAMPTSYASGQFMKLSGTYAGRLSSAIANASLTCTGATGAWHIVAMSLAVNSSASANSTGSVVIQGWLG